MASTDDYAGPGAPTFGPKFWDGGDDPVPSHLETVELTPEQQARWHEFWDDILVDIDAAALPHQVKLELFDYMVTLEEVPKVYDEVTGGRLSKPNSKAEYVIEFARAHYDADRDDD